MNIRVHIERLVLDGVPLAHSQRPLLQAAVEAELARLLAQGGVAPSLQSGGTLPSLCADTIPLIAQSSPAEMGQQIAQSVYMGIGKTK
jgi:hypothetical protein